MINFRLLEPTIRVNQKQNDWFLTSPEECDFAFRVWGGSWETFLTVYDSDKLEFAKRLSEHSFIFIKTIAPHAKHVMKNFDRVRMNNTRIDHVVCLDGKTKNEVVIEIVKNSSTTAQLKKIVKQMLQGVSVK